MTKLDPQWLDLIAYVVFGVLVWVASYYGSRAQIASEFKRMWDHVGRNKKDIEKLDERLTRETDKLAHEDARLHSRISRLADQVRGVGG